MAVCYNANRHINSFCLRLIRYFRRFSVIFIHDSRHGGTSETIGSLPISWKSHPSMVLIEPPPLLESVAGRKYHYPPAFLRRLWLLSKGLWFVFFARFFKVMADITFGCRDFIPAAGLTYFRCCVFNFQDTWNSIFIFFRLYRGRSREFDTPLFYAF